MLVHVRPLLLRSLLRQVLVTADVRGVVRALTITLRKAQQWWRRWTTVTTDGT